MGPLPVDVVPLAWAARSPAGSWLAVGRTAAEGGVPRVGCCLLPPGAGSCGRGAPGRAGAQQLLLRACEAGGEMALVVHGAVVRSQAAGSAAGVRCEQGAGADSRKQGERVGQQQQRQALQRRSCTACTRQETPDAAMVSR